MKDKGIRGIQRVSGNVVPSLYPSKYPCNVSMGIINHWHP